MKSFEEYAEHELELLRKVSNATEDAPLIIEEYIGELLQLAAKFQTTNSQDTTYTRTKLNVVMDALRYLAMLEPLTPLTGAPDEWEPTDIPDTTVNNRHTGVFKKGDSAYCLTAISWQLVNSPMEFYGKIQTQLGEFDSTLSIKRFPFTPRTFVVPVSRSEANPKLFIVHDEAALRKALHFYANA